MSKYHQMWHPKAATGSPEFVHWTHDAWHWVRTHMAQIRLASIAILLFVVAWALVRGYSNFRESAASQIFVQSLGSDAVPSKSVLETVANKYPRTAAGKYADWLLATQFYQENNLAEAGKIYQRLAERTSPHRLYHVLAMEGEGYAEELQGNHTAAAGIFTQLSRNASNPFASQDLLNAARNEWRAGRQNEARALLKSASNPDATQYLLALDALQ